ncbi:MAG: hypothetical protein OSA84_05230 [Akkermansiaceae bacterium]|nr:hypothetical protein [Akkermansiaceae bacterium]
MPESIPNSQKKLEPSGGHGATPERIFRIKILSYDWNFPKFITPRYTEEQVKELISPMQLRVAELESELATLRDQQSDP